MVFLIKVLVKPADKNFLVKRFTSNLKSLAILLALCNSPVMTLRLYLVRIFEDQSTLSFFYLLWTFVSIAHPRLIIPSSKNVVGFFSMVIFFVRTIRI